MVIFRHAHAPSSSVYMNRGIDTSGNGEFGSFFDFTPMTTNEALTVWHNTEPRSVTISDWTVNCFINSNTIDGAQYTGRLALGDDPMIIVLDQATGLFVNVTQTMVVPTRLRADYRYDQGNNTVSYRCGQCRLSIV